MMTRSRVLLLLLPLLGLSGCATMNGDECALSDWQTIGFEDGVNGYTADRIGHHRRACAKHGVAPDFEAYQAGRDRGLREYCQPSVGFNVGASGGRYYGVCPYDSEGDFIAAFNTGHGLYNLRSSVNAVTQQINARNAELEKTDKSIRQVEADLISRDTSVEARVLLLVDLKELSEKRGQLEAEIVALVEERAGHEQNLANYEATLANASY